MHKRILLIGLVSLAATNVNASIYMGTDATMPVNQIAVENLAMPAPAIPIAEPLPPPDRISYSEKVSYFNEETTVIKDAVPLDCEPYNGKGPMPAVPCPLNGEPPMVEVEAAPVMVTVRTGSLRENIDRITAESGWEQMIWKPEYDYNWVGNVTITASDIQGVLTKLLEPYPLQAVFYTANHVVEIMPRRNT